MSDRAKELASAILDGGARHADIAELARWVLAQPDARATDIRVVYDSAATHTEERDGDVYRIVDETGRRYALSSVTDDGCFEAANGMTPEGWEHLTAFTRREAERLAAVLRREQRVIARCEQLADAAAKRQGPRIVAYQDGDVWRVVDNQDRRYYYCPRDSNHAIWAIERCCNGNAWDEHTSFTEREAKLIVDAVQREQRALAVADELATGLSAFEDACGVARAWLSRRRDD